MPNRWPPNEQYFPGDHRGCSCSYEVELRIVQTKKGTATLTPTPAIGMEKGGYFQPSGIKPVKRPAGPVSLVEPGNRPVEHRPAGRGGFDEWSVVTKNGSRVQLVPAFGSGGYVPPELDDKMRSSLLNGVADAYDRNPRPWGPPKIAVHSIQGMAQTMQRELGYDADSAFEEAQGFRAAVISNNRNVIHVVPEVFAQKPYNPKGWLIDAHAAAEPTTGAMAHEYGHVVYFDSNPIDDPDSPVAKKLNALWRDERVAKAMSTYGNGSQLEGYAEAYAEWTLTEGTTKNVAARLFAAAFGWP